MTAEGSCRSEFAQLVTDHVFGDRDFDVLTTVVNHERVSDKLGNNSTGSCPSFDGLTVASGNRLFDLREQFFVDERSFFCDLLIMIQFFAAKAAKCYFETFN